MYSTINQGVVIEVKELIEVCMLYYMTNKLTNAEMQLHNDIGYGGSVTIVGIDSTEVTACTVTGVVWYIDNEDMKLYKWLGRRLSFDLSALSKEQPIWVAELFDKR